MACTGQLRRAKRQARSVRPLARQLPGSGYHGYRFRIIAGRDDQSASPCWRPIAWGETGVMSFMIDQRDRVYQANLGEESAARSTECVSPTRRRLAEWQNLKKRPVALTQPGVFIHLALVRHQRRIAGKGWFCAG